MQACNDALREAHSSPLNPRRLKIKTLLTEKIATLDQVQLDYEDMYMGSGNSKSAKVAPSNIRKEMEGAIKLYIDEVHWMANRMETESWTMLYKNLEQRFNEVNVSVTKQKPDNTADENTKANDTVAA